MSKIFTRLLAIAVMAMCGWSAAWAGEALTLGTVTNTPESSSLYANSDNYITGVTSTVPVTNSGDVEINGFSLSLVDSTTKEVLQTVEYTDVVAVGATVNVELAWNFSLDSWMSASIDNYVRKRVNVKENVSGTEVVAGSTYWHEYYFYKVAYDVVQESSNSTVTALSYGITTEPLTKTVRLRCTGAAPLTLNSVDLPDGFSTDAVLPATVSTDQYITVNIVFDPTKVSGPVSGNAVFHVSGADDQSIALSGTALGADTYLESFDGANLPSNWVFSPADSWKIEDGALYRGLQEYAYAITPKLHFDGSQAVSFDGSPNSTSTYSNTTVCVEVCYSTDRTNWTQLMGVNNTGNGGYEKFPSYTNSFKNYTTPALPEGDYYIGFRMAYCKIDNVVAGSLATVDHDIYITGITVPTEGKVNEAATVTVKAKNLNSVAEPASAYTVALMVDGVQASTATTSDWAAGEEKEFAMEFTPTTPGIKVLKGVFNFGAYSVETEEANVPVFVETAGYVKVGNPNGVNSGAPMNFYNKNNNSEILITAEEMANYGVTPGTVITALAYDGYCSQAKDFTGSLKITLGTTAETSLSASSAPAVLENEVVVTDEATHSYSFKKEGSESAPVQVQEYKFAEPYTYNGGNLVVDILELSSSYLSCAYGEANSSITNRFLYRSADGTLSSWSAGKYLPILKLGVSAVPAKISGVVTDYTNAPVAGATVTLSNDAISYKTVTAADGSYSINVFRNDLTYTLSVSATDLPSATISDISFTDGDVAQNVKLINAEPALVLGSYTTTPGEGNIYANSDNRVSGVSTTITIINAGGTAFQPGDANYSITLFDNSGIELQNIPVTMPLGVGESIDFTFEWDFSLDDIMAKESATALKSWNRIKAVDNVSNTSIYINGTAPWRDFYFWKAAGEICQPDAGTALTSIAYGFVTEATTKALRVRSTGAADLTVTSIDLPDGFTADVECPFTLTSADNAKVINITFTPSTPGAVAGNAVFHFDAIDDIAVALSAKYVAEGCFLETFESGELPTDWVIDGMSVNYNNRGADNKYELYRSTSSPRTWAITPKLHFYESEALSFEAAKGAYASVVACYYSADRANWTLLKGLTGGTTDGAEGYESLPSSSHSYAEYAVNLPEGDWYIGFEMGYAYLDNVFGGSYANVDHDLYIQSKEVASRGKVNNEHPFSITVKNFGSDEESYTACLYVNDELVHSVEGEETLAAGETKTLTVSHFAHEAGDAEMYASVKVGDYEVKTPAVTVSFAPEAAAETIVAGTCSATSSAVPLSTNWNNSESQVVYTAEFLKKYGLTTGTSITGLSFEGTSSAGKTIESTLTYYLKEVEQSTITSAYDLTDVEPVMVNDDFSLVLASSTAEKYDIVSGTFDEPFTYNGGNLLVVVRSEASQFGNSSFDVTNELTKNAIYKRKDNHDAFLNDSFSKQSVVPVAKFAVAKDVYKVYGKVYDGETMIEGAKVTLKAGRVEYYGMTDANGDYSIDVFQPEHTYSITVDADGYAPYTEQGLCCDGQNVNKDFNFSVIDSADLVSVGKHSVKVSGRNIVVNAGSDAEVAVYTATGIMVNRKQVAAGRTVIPATSGVYVVTVGKTPFKVVVR